MEITDRKIEEYIEVMSSGESDLLRQVTRETYIHQVYPRMISGHVQGKFLEFISRIICPFRILEIGTFTAYSTICLSQGLSEGGKIITIEKNPELEDIIMKNLKRAEITEKAELIIGDALEVIPGLEGDFDLVFIDGDKEQYVEYLLQVLPLLKAEGLIMADNVLWDGKVVSPDHRNDKETEGIIRFNQFVVNSDELENVIIPLRDGLSLIRKK